jgi:tetratricopeptide (TPR) repeat protein
MVSLADHLSRAFGAALPTVTPTVPSVVALASSAPVVIGTDWVGLARAHARAGDLDQAIAAYTRGLESMTHTTERAEIFAALGELYKRQRHWTEAAKIWQNWITSVPGSDPTPYVELAKYCEWETRDLEQAQMWAGWALHTVQKASRTPQSATIQRDLQHRLARIQRKRGRDGDTNETN